MPTARRISRALGALHVLVQALDRLPGSTETVDLRDAAHECRKVVEDWHHRPPTAEEHQQVTRRILGLHVAAVRLRRG